VEESKSDPGFLERGGLRRRLRFLRKTRELAYRDLGGLVFEMHRLGQQRDDLLGGKLATLQGIDAELRAIEQALREDHGVTVLREAGVTACPRCAAIHGSEDRFCPACGFSISRGAERPIAAQPVATAASEQAASGQTSSPPPATTPTPSPIPAPTSAPPDAAQSPPVSPTPQRVGPRAPFPPPAADGKDQPTEVIDPPTQIIRPEQTNRT
jgi:hypothetical protein